MARALSALVKRRATDGTSLLLRGRMMSIFAVLTLGFSHDGPPLVMGIPAVAVTTTSPAAASSSIDIGDATLRCQVLPEDGKIIIHAAGDARPRELDLSLVVDGVERTAGNNKTTASAVVRRGIHELSVGNIDIRFDPTKSEIVIRLALAGAPEERPSSSSSLRLSTMMTGPSTTLFVPGHGEVDDVGDFDARIAVLDDGSSRSLAVVAEPSKSFSLALFAPESTGQASASASASAPVSTATAAVSPTRVSFTAATSDGAAASLHVLLGETPRSSQRVWGAAYERAGEPTGRIEGSVFGTSQRARVVGVDEGGHPQVRFWTDDSKSGHFSVDAPLTATRWYAMIDSAQACAPITHTPGARGDVRLEVQPGGKVHVRVVDPDTTLPLISRLLVRGLDGTLDPRLLNGDFHGGVAAGPLIDLRSGEATITGLPAGRYRIAATRGIEWSIDTAIVDVANGGAASIVLEPRHVVATPLLVGCDLHVHAKPSFDSPLRPEDRILSLASAGIDFAVPTEHNRIGDYTTALEAQRRVVDGAALDLGWARGVEVTTERPALGHFGVFPIAQNAGPPPYRGTNAGALFAAARKASPSSAIVVHHPRLTLGLGYFNDIGFDAKIGKIPPAMETDFDVLEVYSGAEIQNRDKVERVLADWFALLNLGKHYAASGSSDSHKLQFQWAGYPRTYVRVNNEGAGPSLDVNAIVTAVKAGRGFVTSGPMISFDAGGIAPGEELKLNLNADHVTGVLRVDAAPWIDVSSIEIVAGGTSILHREVPAHEVSLGREAGTASEASARTVRFEGPVELAIPATAKWIVVVVRGNRSYADILPFMPVQPMAFTNPIWIVR